MSFDPLSFGILISRLSVALRLARPPRSQNSFLGAVQWLGSVFPGKRCCTASVSQAMRWFLLAFWGVTTVIVMSRIKLIDTRRLEKRMMQRFQFSCGLIY